MIQNAPELSYIPFYLLIPNILEAKALCYEYYTYPYTLVGLGEIVIPGLSLSYSLIMDLNSKRFLPLYFILNLIGIVLGFGINFFLLTYVKMNQPALIYACSILIFINFLTSYLDTNFSKFVNGIFD